MANQSCELSIVRAGDNLDTVTDCSKEAAARKIYAEVAPATVKIESSFAIGSGFFVGDGSRIVTNAHVVNGEDGLFDVTTPDKKQYKARIEKLDDVNDLAIIHLEDGAKGDHVLKLGDSNAVKLNQALYAIGHPLGRSETFISPGYFTAKGDFDKVFGSKDPADKDWLSFLRARNDTDKNVAADAVAITKSPRVEAKMQIEPGNSGGPMVNESDEVVAVSQFGSDSKQYHDFAWAVPSEKISELLKNKPKFEFEYGRVSDAKLHPKLTAGLTVVGSALAFGLPRGGGAVLGAIGALDGALLMANDFDHPKTTADKAYKGLEVAFDAGMVTGAVLSWMPELKPYAYAAYGVGLASGLAQSFVPHDTGLIAIYRTANPADKRQPMFWNGIS